MTNLYDVLGVPANVDEAELKRAYRRRQRETHPDVKGGDAAAFREVTDAWKVLGDPASRASYDRSLLQPTYTPRKPQEPAYGDYGAPGVYVSADTFLRMAEEIRRMEEESLLNRMEMQERQDRLAYLMHPSFPLYGRVFPWATGWYGGSYQAGVAYERTLRWKRGDALAGVLLILGLVLSVVIMVLTSWNTSGFSSNVINLILAYMGVGIIVIVGFLSMWAYRWFRWILRPNLRRFGAG